LAIIAEPMSDNISLRVAIPPVKSLISSSLILKGAP